MSRTVHWTLFAVASGWISYGQTVNPPITFEVASLKPAGESSGPRSGCSGGPGTSTPGRLECRNTSLSGLLLTAYKLEQFQFAPPAWMSAARFEVSAKIPDGATVEQVRVMEQNLLRERFKLVVHFEDKEIPGYELTVSKSGPKLKPTTQAQAPASGAVQSARMGIDSEGFPVLPGTESGGYMLNGRATLRLTKTTTEALANWLVRALGRPVKDATSLTGTYDLTLRYVADPMPAAATPSEPESRGATLPTGADGGPTLLGAVQSQLGLKMEPKKVVVKFLVVDHAERVPIEN